MGRRSGLQRLCEYACERHCLRQIRDYGVKFRNARVYDEAYTKKDH